MYDELIKALRDPAHSLDCEFCDSRYCHPDRKGYGKCIIIKAADAIENMSEAYEKLSRHMDDLAALMPRWISVSERLPESGERVLACCRVKWLGGGWRTYVCAAFHSAPKTETCGYSDGIGMEYDEETDEYYLPEGWWEVINNWDDYSFVAIGDFVTHWQPLPEPPKEE